MRKLPHNFFVEKLFDRFLFLIELNVCVCLNNFQIYLSTMGWIRIRNSENSKLDPDPE